MRPIIYEDKYGAWDAVDIKNLIWEHQEFESEIKELKLKLIEATTGKYGRDYYSNELMKITLENNNNKKTLDIVYDGIIDLDRCSAIDDRAVDAINQYKKTK